MQVAFMSTYSIFSNLYIAMGEPLLTTSTHCIALVTKDASECV